MYSPELEMLVPRFGLLYIVLSVMAASGSKDVQPLPTQ
jgi:hypothetical protein